MKARTRERGNGGTPERRIAGTLEGGKAGTGEDGRRGKRAKSSATGKKALRGRRSLLPSFPRSASAAARAPEILSRLKQRYPDAECALNYKDAFQLLCATILSAQCTDVRVNMVTPTLFARYPTAFDLARAEPRDVEEIIKSTGFFRNKTKSLIGMAQALVADFGGEVPQTMPELRKLPGVGRKTANVLLGNAYGINEGITVDTHVARLSGLLGLSRQEDPVKIEQELMALFPRDDWGLLSHLLIFHGRQVCIARRPRCGECVLASLCPSSLV